MKITEQLKIGVNRAIERIAEKYQEETQYDEEGHGYRMCWSDCIDHGIDDFRDDVSGYMLLMDYELTDDECKLADEYAKEVNWETIMKYA